jgi:hypothetical protein
MTELLKKLIERVSGLPDEEQDAIASVILEELEDEVRWRESFARSQDALSGLARKAREDIARGGTEPFDSASKPE